MRRLRLALFYIGLTLASQWVQSEQDIEPTPAIITTGIPPGFDDLLEPQIALIDIFYNGQPILSSMATYTQDWIMFEHPEAILKGIDNIADHQIILSTLSSRLKTNISLVCYYKSQENCGYLSPEAVGVIFDEGQFRVDLFINPTYVTQTHFRLDAYLPPSTSQWSLINSVSVTAAGGDETENIHNIQLNSILGYKNYHLQMAIDNDNENQTRLDQFSLVYDYRDIAYEIGSFKTFTQLNGFYTQRDFMGARVQTSLSSRTDLEQVTGSSIFVFLSERSQVDVFKDGQLIDSRIYDAGNTEIDTRDFPNGAYDIELKITGASGRETLETHFYSKSLRLPPLDETLYFAEFGAPKINSNEQTYRTPHARSHLVFRTGLMSRLSEKIGLNASVAANSDDFSAELGSFVLADRLSFQNNHVYSDNGGWGNYYQLDFNYDLIALTASYRKTDRKEQVNYGSEYELLQSDSRQVLLNLSVPFNASTLNFFARENERLAREKTQTYGATWRKNIFRGQSSLVDFSIDATRDDSDIQVLVGFNLRLFFKKADVGLSARQNHKRLKSEAGEKDTKNHVDRTLRVAFKNQHDNIGSLSNLFEINQQQKRKTVSFKSELSNENGFGRIELQEINANGDKRLGYSMNSRFNIVASDGTIAIGGNRRHSAGVMINLESIDSDELSFSVVINGVERAKIDAGKRRFIALQPFNTYKVLLSPRGQTLVNYDNKPKVVTLYPGNIENMVWKINAVKVVIMQVLDIENTPVANAWLKDFNGYARTDDLGWIQLRLEDTSKLHFVDKNGGICAVDIAPQDMLETVNYLAEKRCQ